jgi:regulatory protein YycH of two-component signal transduction system YycFG
MIIEHVKTVILWALILTSILLTWLIWNYEPAYTDLGESEYIETEEIGEERSLSDIIMPDQIIIHEEENRYWIHPFNENYENIMEILGSVEVSTLIKAGNSARPQQENTYEGLELTFPGRIQADWLLEMMEFKDPAIPLSTVDRILFFVNPSSADSDVSIRLYSFEEEEVYQAGTRLSLNELNQLFSSFNNDRTAVESLLLDTSSEAFPEIHYVPSEAMNMTGYVYQTKDISPDSLIQLLFSDPRNVKMYFPGNGEQQYTDGNRMINILQSESDRNRIQILDYYHHPGAQNEQSDRSAVQTSLEFVNGHSGWTDKYILEDWRENGNNDRVFYRMHVNGLPVIRSGANREEYHTIQMSRTGNQITEYVRPLFELHEELSQSEISLPSFEEVVGYIEEDNTLVFDLIEDIRIGHYMIQRQSYFSFEPSWFVKQRGTWQQINMRDGGTGELIDREAEPSGLE